MQLTSLRVYQVFLGLVSLVYGVVLLLSVSGLLFGIVSVCIVQDPNQQFRTKAAMMLCSLATLPLACMAAIAGSWSLFFLRRYSLAPLPLLLPFVSIALILLVVGKDLNGVMGLN